MAKKILSILVTASLVLLVIVYFMDGKDQFTLSVEIEHPKAAVSAFIVKPPLEYNLIDGFVSLNFDKSTQKGQGVLTMMDRQERIEYTYDELQNSGEFSLKGIQGSFVTKVSQVGDLSVLETQFTYQVEGMFAKLFQSLITKVIEQKFAEDHLRFGKQFQKPSTTK